MFEHRFIVAQLSSVLFLAAAGRASALPGDIATKFKVDDANPVASIPSEEQRNRDPLEFSNFMQDLIARAEGGFQKKDWAAAAKYYEALARAVPDRAFPFSRLCSAYAELGQLDFAIGNCQKSIRLNGARVLDHFHLVNLMLKRPTLAKKDIEELDASLAELRQQVEKQKSKQLARPAAPSGSAPAVPLVDPKKLTREQLKEAFETQRAARILDAQAHAAGRPPSVTNLPLEVEVLACRVAVRLRDAGRLELCTTKLRAEKADEKLILPFEWSRALTTKDSARASTLLAAAERSGLPPEVIAQMKQEQKSSLGYASLRSAALVFAVSLVAAALLALALLRAAAVRRVRPSPAP